MRILLLIPTLVFALNLQSEVNWWEHPLKEPKKTKSVNGTRIKISSDRIFEESVKWYENKLKREKAPAEYYFFLDPNNPIYRDAYIKWLRWKQEKLRQIVYSSLGSIKNERELFRLSLKDVIEALKGKGYRFMFFYNRNCPYCRADFPEVEKLAKHFEVYWIEIHEAPQMFAKWKISATPTLIAVSPKEKKAARWEGYFRYPDVLFFFYQKLFGTQDR